MVGESQEPVGSTVGGGSSGSNKMPTLEEYGTNLTQQVRHMWSQWGQSGKRAGRRRRQPSQAKGAALHCRALLRTGCAFANMPTLLCPVGSHCSCQAEEGKLDPVVGRKKEIERVTQASAGLGCAGGEQELASCGGVHAFTAQRQTAWAALHDCMWLACHFLQCVWKPPSPSALFHRFWAAAPRTTRA